MVVGRRGRLLWKFCLWQHGIVTHTHTQHTHSHTHILTSSFTQSHIHIPTHASSTTTHTRTYLLSHTHTHTSLSSLLTTVFPSQSHALYFNLIPSLIPASTLPPSPNRFLLIYIPVTSLYSYLTNCFCRNIEENEASLFSFSLLSLIIHLFLSLSSLHPTVSVCVFNNLPSFHLFLPHYHPPIFTFFSD